ncbi:hypothetical protein [Inmirania thermothiophila]|uniref:MSHA biogenesis protein MshI n=1 Tax=Inmirania thermothiophila TaxID=1750597 RepID=A0A3N1Y627_9GAMM|nr:hypothetical protein [Inmirania thermothiophila]ROR34210.1 MSHA biogenesis protein MshI [Inmirania thermothiophila]
MVEACERWVEGDQRWRGRAACAVLARSEYKLLQVERPQVAEAELAEAVRWRIRDLLDFPAASAVVDVFPVGEAGDARPQLYAVAAPGEAVDARVRALRGAGMRVRAIEIPELALARLAGAAGPADRAVALLAAETGTSLLVVARNGALYLARTLPVGVEVAAASAPAADGTGLALEVDPRIESMALELQRTFDHFESHFGLGAVQELLVVTGEGAAEAAARLDAALGVRARALEAQALGRWDAERAALDPAAACALGAVLRLREEGA